MKTLIQHATLALFLAFGLPLGAQETAPDATLQGPTTPAKPVEPTISPLMQPMLDTPAPLPLMPEPIQSTASGTAVITGSAAPTPTPLPKKGTIEQLRTSVRIRELQTRVLLNDPEITAQCAIADKARTPNGYRAAMRNYYSLLTAKIERIDPSLTPVLELRLYQQLYALEQHKLRPARLLEPIAPVKGSNSADHAPPTVSGTAKSASPPPPPEAPAADQIQSLPSGLDAQMLHD